MSTRGRRRLAASVSAILVAGIVSVAIAAPAAARPHPPVPEQPTWPARVLPLVRFVEENRGLDFDHPVTVTLLSERAFVRRERREAEFFGVDVSFRLLLGRLRALGLMSARQPVAEAAAETGLLGWFDPYLEELVIRGDDLDDPAVRTVLVHELAHALVAQRFTGGRLNSGSFAVTALVEGDASAVEAAYVESLGRRARERVAEALFGDPSEGEISALGVLTLAPYGLGQAYVELIDLLGNRNAAFRDPPRDDVEVIDPLREPLRTGAVNVESRPRLERGEAQRGPRGELGQMLVFLTLASRLDVNTATAAAIGWGADRYVAYRLDGRDCLRIAIKGETIVDHGELVEAFRRWASAGPGGAATVEARPDDLLVTTCETDARLESATNLSEDVGLVLAGRLQWAARALREQGATPPVARCVGDAMALDSQVLDAERRAVELGIRLRDLDPAVRAGLEARLHDLVAGCRAGVLAGN